MQKKHGIVGIKDVDLIILSNLDDKDLLSFCNVDTYANELCKNEMFWKRRVFEKLGNIKKEEKRTWRDLYLKIVYYKDKYENNPYKILSKLFEKKEDLLTSDLVDYFIKPIRIKIYNAMILEIEAGLTVGRSDNGLNPLTTAEIKKFIEKYEDEIQNDVNEMISSFYNDGDIEDLENPENDWYREFLDDIETKIYNLYPLQ